MARKPVYRKHEETEDDDWGWTTAIMEDLQKKEESKQLEIPKNLYAAYNRANLDSYLKHYPESLKGPYKFAIGDIVQYTRRFLLSIGTPVNDKVWFLEGKVIEIDIPNMKDFVRCEWSDDRDSTVVHSSALGKKHSLRCIE